jgi:hypothetical protein
MNAEHREAVEVDRRMAPVLRRLAARGAVLVDRNAAIGEDGELVLSYVMMRPLAIDEIKVQFYAVKLP